MHFASRFLLVMALGCHLFLLAACSTPEVTYPASNTGGNSENHPGDGAYGDGPGRISEEIGRDNEGPVQDSLDSSGGGAGASFDDNGDQHSDAYKREYGRCSPGMKPVYFQFDRAVIESSQLSAIESNATYLQASPDSHVLIEGNTDERGTNEYNLALGERRAQIAKKYLIQLGVDSRRIRTISYGKERPLFLGQSEDDYVQNRRDDFIVE